MAITHMRATLLAISRDKWLRWIALVILLSAAALLRFYNLASLGYANHYYSAAILSMTQSWHNFFFAAAEPGGSVSLDKPPLGLWFQAVSAAIFGINSFGLLLPQILAGIFSVLLVYHLVRRSFGTLAGLLAGLIMAISPVIVAIDRNNTMDSMLIFTLLLAAWAFVKAAETSQTRFLIAGTCLVGAGFNIKMLEAFVPLPAFFLLYFTGAKESARYKLLKSGAAFVLLLIVSLSWVTIVDLTDRNQRPYVDNSSNDSELSLVTGYNGIERMMGVGYVMGTTSFGAGFPGTGKPGFLRLLIPPLNKEISWLAPMGLVGIVALIFGSRLKWPFSPEHQMVVLWGGWLAAGAGLLSMAVFIHEYYLSIAAPPLAAMSAIGIIKLWQLRKKYFWLAVVATVGSAGGCLIYQVYTAQNFIKVLTWLPALYLFFTSGTVLMMIGGIFLTLQKNQMLSTARPFPVHIFQKIQWVTASGMICMVGGLLLTPGIWAGLTSIFPNKNPALPMSYDGQSTEPGILSGLLVDTNLLNTLQENTKNNKYLLAVPSSMQGADYILATGRPVLYIGGFTGLNQAITCEQMETMVSTGELRYIYWNDGFDSGLAGVKNVSDWLNSSCKVVPGFETETYPSMVPDGTFKAKDVDMPCTYCRLMQMSLYDCKKDQDAFIDSGQYP